MNYARLSGALAAVALVLAVVLIGERDRIERPAASSADPVRGKHNACEKIAEFAVAPAERELVGQSVGSDHDSWNRLFVDNPGALLGPLTRVMSEVARAGSVGPADVARDTIGPPESGQYIVSGTIRLRQMSGINGYFANRNGVLSLRVWERPSDDNGTREVRWYIDWDKQEVVNLTATSMSAGKDVMRLRIKWKEPREACLTINPGQPESVEKELSADEAVAAYKAAQSMLFLAKPYLP